MRDCGRRFFHFRIAPGDETTTQSATFRPWEVAATRVHGGTDVDFGALTKGLGKALGEIGGEARARTSEDCAACMLLWAVFRVC